MSAPHDDDERTPLERLVPELLKKAIETGTKSLSPETIRQVVGELKIPKEALHHTISQLDETKSGVYRVIGKELRDLFDRTSLADELAKALSLLTLEVKMEVRFKPNEAKPSEESKASRKRRPSVGAGVKIKRSDPPPEPPTDDETDDEEQA